MKHTRSASPATPNPDERPASSPADSADGTPTPSKKIKGSPKKTSPKKTPSPKKASPAKPTKPNGMWSPDKRELFLDLVIAVGYKHADLDEMADKLELSKRQLVDQLVPNKSNLRGKAAKMARGE